jgi:hypothetical protein
MEAVRLGSYGLKRTRRVGIHKVMWHGFAAPPQTLLKKYLGIELNGPPLITDAIVVLLDKLEQGYSAKVPTEH